jgi:GT2 family glycosyltransferase
MRAMAEARGTLVARMDADDVSHPDRLQRQLAAFEQRPDAAAVAALHETIDAAGRPVRGPDFARLLRGGPFPPFAHGSVMFRRSAVDAVGGYREGNDFWEDIDLLLRLAYASPILVLTQPLYCHRLAETSIRNVAGKEDVIAAYGRLYRSFELRDHSRTSDTSGSRVAPDAFRLLGSARLWAGASPGLFSMLLRYGRLRPDANTAKALLWGAWAELSPKSLRTALRGLLAFRNWRAARQIEGKTWVAWAAYKGWGERGA